jgi:hypothetical protein
MPTVTTSLETLPPAGELYADMIAEFEHVNMPPDVLTDAIELDEFALRALAATKAVRDLKNDTVRDKMLSDCYILGDDATPSVTDYVESLRLDEELQIHQLAQLRLLAEHGVYNAGVRLDDGPELLYQAAYDNSLGFVYMQAISGDPQGRLKALNFSTVDATHRFVLLADKISDAGQQRVHFDNIRPVIQPLIVNAVELKGQSDSLITVTQEAVDERPIQLLQALVIIDMMGFAKGLPEEYLATLTNAQTGDVLEPHQLITLRLMSGLHSSTVLTDEINLLFEDAPRDGTGELVDEYAQYYSRVCELARAWDLLAGARKAAGIIASTAQTRCAEGVLHIGQQSSHIRHRLGVAANKFLIEAGARFSANPSQESMVAALSAEKWVQAVFDRRIATDPMLAKGANKNYMQLHSAIEKQVQAEQLAELKHHLDKQMARIQEIDAQYTISARLLRKLGGLDLRRQLENWVEPGSNRTLFTQDEAQRLAGLALLSADSGQAQSLKRHETELSQLWSNIAFLSGGNVLRSGLVRTVDTLLEWHESATDKMLRDPSLEPIWRLAELLESTPPEQAPEKSEHPEINQAFEHIEFIEPFPPEVTANDIVTDLTARTNGYRGDAIEWERIYSLVELRAMLERQGHVVETHRLLQTAWHPLPHYVLEVLTPGDKVIAIVESPIYRHATYVIPHDNWRNIVKKSRKQVRDEHGGIPKVHSANATPEDHRNKLYKVITGLTGQ